MKTLFRTIWQAVIRWATHRSSNNDAATTLLGAPARELLENPLQKYLRLDGVRAQLKGGGEIEVCITPAGGTGQTTEKLVVCNTAGTERSRQ